MFGWQFNHLSQFPELVHGVTPRLTPERRSFNLAWRLGGRDEVWANRDRLRRLGGPDCRLISARQVHGAAVAAVSAATDGATELDGFDALITAAPELMLLIKTADCQGVLMYAPRCGVVAAAHSGWRGSVANVLGTTVAAMVSAFGVDPAELRVGIGPSLGPCCAEFSDPATELPDWMQPFVLPSRRIDFWAVSRAQLLAAGVLPSHLEIAAECTRCRVDRWFSHRGDRPDCGRFGAVICRRS